MSRGLASSLKRRLAGEAAPGPDPRDLERRPLGAGPVRVAAITCGRNEAAWLPRWIGYYGAQLGVENLYVVDDNSTDGSTDDLPCDVIRIPEVRDGEFEPARMGVLGNLARALFHVYDAVIFTDVDEFVVPDPQKYDGLRDFVARQPNDTLALAAQGLNVIHDVSHESTLDPAAPVLGQRCLAKFLPLMCKPALKWVPAHWSAASHGLNAPYRVHPDLWMFHMKFADVEQLRRNADLRKAQVEVDGRSAQTNWSKGGDALVELLEGLTSPDTDSAKVAEFTSPADLAALVVTDGPARWRAPRGNQLELMRKRALVRIPERFHGIV